jgi:hypothetical protein
MQEGWYYRALANDNIQTSHPHSQNGIVEEEIEEEIPGGSGDPDYRSEYQNLKKKLKFLLYVRGFLSRIAKTIH